MAAGSTKSTGFCPNANLNVQLLLDLFNNKKKKKWGKLKIEEEKYNSAAVLCLLCVEKSSRILAWTSQIVAC